MRLFFTLVLFATICFSNAQKCFTPDQMFDPNNLEERLEMNRVRSIIHSNNRSDDEELIFPTVVHVIYNSDSYHSGNISDAQVLDGIRIINEDFNKRNADTTITDSVFTPFAANMNMKFRLAQFDENGNPTNGIVRVDTNVVPKASHGDDSDQNNIKYVSAWDPTKYFNIWIVRTIRSDEPGAQIQGYAQYPGPDFTYGGPWETWGVVVRYKAWGIIEEAEYDGRTGTHEIGHCFGLYHTFKSSGENDCGSVCDTTGDEVCDTPPSYVSYGCDRRNDCDNDSLGNSAYSTDVHNQIENFMSYSDCQSMFTEGQKTRARGFINAYDVIQGLSSTDNLKATGTLYEASIYEAMESQKQFSIYPNPSKEFIHINGIESEAIVHIYDQLGKLVHRSSVFNAHQAINIQHLPAGFYNLQIETKNRIESLKLLKQ